MDFMNPRRIFMHFLIFIALKDEMVHGLKCWRCITEHCEKDPEDIDQASEEKCRRDQMCQKVEYKMYSTINGMTYTSTVRSCAFDCMSKDDFIKNCTKELLSTRGCSRRMCCSDEDMCNSSPNTLTSWLYCRVVIPLTVTLLYTL